MVFPLWSRPRTNELPTAAFFNRLGMGVGVNVRVLVGVLVIVAVGRFVMDGVGVSSTTGNERLTLVAAAYVVPNSEPPDWLATIVQVPFANRLTFLPLTRQIAGVVDVYVIGRPESAVAARSNAGS